MKELIKMMHKSKRGESGFTLIELMIVVIIVGILAAAAVPIYTSYVKKAYKTEAEASLGAIRTAEIAYKAEHGEFTATLGSGGLEMTSADFANNRYFGYNCFTISTGAPAYAKCDGSIGAGSFDAGKNNASGAADVTDITRYMKLDSGELSDGLPGS